jgi:glyceraldehyde-3-phosphate dehydrogenase (NADP+)
VSHGARLINPEGGRFHQTLVAPAVLFPVSPAARVYTEEQFGPIVPVTTFSNQEDLLRFVSASQYGQQVSLFGREPRALAGLVDELANQVCRININAQCQRGPDTLPFTGRKDSAGACRLGCRLFV